MALDLNIFKNDLANIISDLPTSYTYNSQPYTGIKSKLSLDKNFAEIGTLDAYVFSIVSKMSDFETLPEIDDEITYNGTAYRIAKITPDSCDCAVRFDLAEKI